MVTNASYSSPDINSFRVDIISTNRYSSLLVVSWVVQVTETSVKTSKVQSEINEFLVNILNIVNAFNLDANMKFVMDSDSEYFCHRMEYF